MPVPVGTISRMISLEQQRFFGLWCVSAVNVMKMLRSFNNLLKIPSWTLLFRFDSFLCRCWPSNAYFIRQKNFAFTNSTQTVAL